MSSFEELHLHPSEDESTLIDELDNATADDSSSNVQKLTLYNLEISHGLARSIRQFLQARLSRIRSSSRSVSKTFVLEILGCMGCVDLVLETYASGRFTGDDGAVVVLERRLVLQHTHWNHFDAAVFATLGMALDGRFPPSNQRDQLSITLYQPVLSEAKLWTLAQGIGGSQHLTELDFGSCCFTPMDVNGATNILAQGLRQNQSLVSLSFEGCELDDNQIVCLLQEGLQGHPTLQKLNIKDNLLRSGGMIALAQAFSSSRTAQHQLSPPNNSLPSLELILSDPIYSPSGNQDDAHGNHHHFLLSPSVQQTWQSSIMFLSRLVALNLSRSQLNDWGLQTLLGLLFPKVETTDHSSCGACCTSHLERLDLSYNAFTETGFDSLVEVIQTYQSCNNGCRWKELKANSSFQLNDAALAKLVRALKVNVDLEKVGLWGCFTEETFNHPWRDSIHYYYTMLNKGGRRILKSSPTAIPLGLWPHLLERVNHRIEWDSMELAHNPRSNVLFQLLVSQSTIFVDRQSGSSS